MLTPSASSTDVIADKDNVYQVCFTDPAQGTASAQYIAEHKLAEKVAVIYNNADAYSTGIYQTFEAKAAELGISITYKEFNGQNDQSLLNQIGAQVVADGVDVIIPVATTAVGNSGATNAGLLAVSILSTTDERLAKALQDYRDSLKEKVAESNAQLV